MVLPCFISKGKKKPKLLENQAKTATTAAQYSIPLFFEPISF